MRLYKLYPINAKVIVNSEFPDKHFRSLQEQLQDKKRLVTNHHLLASGVTDRINKRKLATLYKVDCEWEQSTTSVMLAASILMDYVTASGFRCHNKNKNNLCNELIEAHGLCAILQFFGCSDMNSANIPSFKRLLHLACKEFVSAFERARVNGATLRSANDLISSICSESFDSLRPATRTGEIEVEFIRLNPYNPRGLQVKYKGCENYYQISLCTLKNFILTDGAVVDALLALFQRGIGDPYYLPPGAREGNSDHLGSKRKRDDVGYGDANCMVTSFCYAPESVLSPAAKRRCIQRIQTLDHQMIGARALREICEECVRSTHIGKVITEDVQRRAMEDMDVVMLAVARIRDSSVTHCVLIDSTKDRITRARNNGVIIDPQKGGAHPRCLETLEELEIVEFTELYVLHKKALSEATRVALSKLMPEYGWL